MKGSTLSSLVLALMAAMTASSALAADTDGDGVIDPVDTCLLEANPGQQDTDFDGLGNACDADFNQDGWVTAADYLLLRRRLNTRDPLTDLNGDGWVTAADYLLLRAQLNQPPGPAGVPTYRVHGLGLGPYVGEGEDPNLGDGQLTPERLRQRIQKVAAFTGWIRTFGCNNDLRSAGRLAHEAGLKIAAGAWLSGDRVENRNQMDCLLQEAVAGHVDLAVIGSEVLLRGDLGEAALVDYIEEAKQTLQAAGRSVPVTYSDVYGVLLGHAGVLASVDVVFANYYPYWEGRPIELAVAHLHRAHERLRAAAGGKPIIVSETGWPSCGTPVGEAAPSPENAARFFLDFVSWARAGEVPYFYFETYDEPWKAAWEGPQGACWGLWTREGVIKPGMERVFDNETVPSNWSEPLPDAPLVVDPLTLPAVTT